MSESIMHNKMDNLARALDSLYSVISALDADYFATGHMSEAVGKKIALDLHFAGVELCEYWKIERKASE